MGRQTPVMGVEMAGYGVARPEAQFTNNDLRVLHDPRLTLTDAQVRKGTGIESRGVAGKHEDVVTLSIAAGASALAMAGIEPGQVDSLIVGTTSASLYRPVPGIDPEIFEGLGLEDASSMEINAACTSSVMALVEGYRRMAVDGDETVLVVAGDTLSRMVDGDDDNIAFLFGDAAGAWVLRKTENTECGLLAWKERTKPMVKALYCDPGETLKMDGRVVFRKAIELAAEVGQDVLNIAGVQTRDVKLVPHQANIRIITGIAEQMGMSMDQVITTVATDGNTSAASIPLARSAAMEGGLIKPDDLVLSLGFGAGMKVGGVLTRG